MPGSDWIFLLSQPACGKQLVMSEQFKFLYLHSHKYVQFCQLYSNIHSNEAFSVDISYALISCFTCRVLLSDFHLSYNSDKYVLCILSGWLTCSLFTGHFNKYTSYLLTFAVLSVIVINSVISGIYFTGIPICLQCWTDVSMCFFGNSWALNSAKSSSVFVGGFYK